MAIRKVEDLSENLQRKQRVRREFVREIRQWSNSTLDRKIAKGQHPAPLPKQGPGPDEWPLGVVIDCADGVWVPTPTDHAPSIRKLRARARDNRGRLLGNAPQDGEA